MAHLSGMETVATLFAKDLAGTPDDGRRVFAERYGAAASGLVRFVDGLSEDGVLSYAALSGRDDMKLSVRETPSV